MKIYLDTCSLQRPLDSKNQIRVSLEAEAVLGVLTLCESDQVELLSSDALVFEAQQNPIAVRKEYALEVLSRAHSFITLNKRVESRAEEFNKQGMEPLDALHLALAEEAEADYFCTCDDQFLKRAKAVKNLQTKVVTPIELIEEIENGSRHKTTS